MGALTLSERTHMRKCELERISMEGIGNGESNESDGIHTHDDEEDGNEERSCLPESPS